MKSKSREFIKVISLMIIVVFIVSIFIFKELFLQKFYNLSSNNQSPQTSNSQGEEINTIIHQAIKVQMERSAKANEDIVEENGNGIDLGTTPDHWKELGIENAQISSEEEKNFYQTVALAVKAQLEYNSIKKEESLEKVNSLYLQEGFEEYKKNANNWIGYRSRESGYTSYQGGYQFYSEIKTMRFSKPRTYRGISDRIGVINYVDFNDPNANYLAQLFIFKNVNGAWKIEKQREISIPLYVIENELIKEIESENKK